MVCCVFIVVFGNYQFKDVKEVFGVELNLSCSLEFGVRSWEMSLVLRSRGVVLLIYLFMIERELLWLVVFGFEGGCYLVLLEQLLIDIDGFKFGWL